MCCFRLLFSSVLLSFPVLDFLLEDETDELVPVLAE